jgi:hemoglobin/transferrin/lactoferrin receptor protein
VNLQNVRIRGVEARGHVGLPAGFAFSASAAYSRGEYDSEGVQAPLESIDPWKVVAGVDWKSTSGRLGTQLNTTYVHGKEPARAGVTCTPSCFLSPAFTLVDLIGWWRITDALTVRGGVFNVTDQKYWWWSDVRGLASNSPARDGYSQPGRNITVSLSYRF